MKLFILPVIIALCVVTTSAQTYKVFKGDTINSVDAKGKQQGLWRKYYPNDSLFSEGHYKDGKHIGTFNTFHRNGQRQSVLRFRGLTEISDAILYNDSAQMIAKGKYINKNKDSLWVYFDGPTGRKTADEFYKNGVEEGTWNIYFPNGTVAESVVYKNGKKNGPYKKFFDNGKPRLEGTMVNNEISGKVTLYFSDGKIWQQGVYKAGDKHGIWTTFKDDGSVELQQEFINGLPKDSLYRK
jgi:antitoxin component YwqK of YwqJK toxin-antitoxin module